MKKILLAFLIGAAIGFAVGLFRPPKERRSDATWAVDTPTAEPQAQASVK